MSISNEPIAVQPNEWINPSVIQQVLVVNDKPLEVIAFWPTNTAMNATGKMAEDILKAWHITDEEGNLPQDCINTVTANKLGVGPNVAPPGQPSGAPPNGNPSLRPLG